MTRRRILILFWSAVIAAQAGALAVLGVITLRPLFLPRPAPAIVAAQPLATGTHTATPGANVVPTNAFVATAPPQTMAPPTMAPSRATAASAVTSVSSPPPSTGTVEPTVVGQILATSQATGLPTAGPSESATSPTFVPTALATPTQAPDWTFSGVRLAPDPDYRQLHLYGYLINGTGTAQEVTSIDGTFYDAQGQVIASGDQVADLWAFDVVAPGSAVPFELTAIGITDAARFDLAAGGEGATDAPRSNFEFVGVSQTLESQIYCVDGAVRNPAGALQSYLSVVVTLLDADGRVVNFDAALFADVAGLVGDQTLNFDICIWPPNEGTTRYELQAWGF